MTELLVYKTIYINEHQKLVSSNVVRRYAVEYRIGEKTFPEIGKLFAFKEQHQADNFSLVLERVLLCEAKKSDIQPELILDMISANALEGYWNTVTNGATNEDLLYIAIKGFFVLDAIVPGTIFCDWIKPIKYLHLRDRQ